MISERSVAIKALLDLYLSIPLEELQKKKKIHINNSNEVSFISVIYTYNFHS